jgi:hypothetical protein
MAEIKDKFSVVVLVLHSKDHLCNSLTSRLTAVDRYCIAEIHFVLHRFTLPDKLPTLFGSGIAGWKS